MAPPLVRENSAVKKMIHFSLSVSPVKQNLAEFSYRYRLLFCSDGPPISCSLSLKKQEHNSNCIISFYDLHRINMKVSSAFVRHRPYPPGYVFLIPDDNGSNQTIQRFNITELIKRCFVTSHRYICL